MNLLGLEKKRHIGIKGIVKERSSKKVLTFREVKALNSITIDIASLNAEINSILPKLSAEDYFKLPFNEGVLKVLYDDSVLYFYFKYINEKECLIKLYTYTRDTYDFDYNYTMYSKFNKLNKLELGFNGNAHKSKEIEFNYKNFVGLIEYVNYYMDQRETVIKKSKSNNKRSSKNIDGSSNKAKINYEKKKVEVINKNKVIYIMQVDDETFKEHRKYRRRAEQWTVKGFFRHYKSGKTVWVNSFTKGQGREVKKDYIIQ